MVNTASFCVPSFSHNTGVWCINRETDGFAVAYTALAKLALRRAVKTKMAHIYNIHKWDNVWQCVHVLNALKCHYNSSPGSLVSWVHMTWHILWSKEVFHNKSALDALYNFTHRMYYLIFILSTLVLKSSLFSKSFPRYPFLRLISWNVVTRCLVVTAAVVLVSVADCQPSWFLVHIVILTYSWIQWHRHSYNLSLWLKWANTLFEPQYLLGLTGWWPVMAWV